jgi:replicative DNA helicase Mcm
MSVLSDMSDMSDTKSDKNDKYDNRTISQIIKIKTKSDKLLCFLFISPLTDKEIAEKISCDVRDINKMRERHGDKIIRIDDSRPAKWTLSNAARLEIEKEIQLFQEKEKVAEKQKQLFLESQREKEAEEAEEAQLLNEIEDFLFDHPEYEQTIMVRNHLLIDLGEVMTASKILSDKILDSYDAFVPLCRSKAVSLLSIPNHKQNFEILVKNPPKSSFISVAHLRCEHINKICHSEVEIDSISEIRPCVEESIFSCPSCGNIFHVLQKDETYTLPTGCSCGRKGKFTLVHETMINTCYVRFIQPLSEIIGNNVYRSRVKGIIRGSLTSESMAKHIYPGSQIKLTYIPRTIKTTSKTGQQLVQHDLVLEVLYFEPCEAQIILQFSPDEIEMFQEESKKPSFPVDFAESCFPNHFGDLNIKLACAAQLVSSSLDCRRKDQTFHIFMCGDPGTDKSGFLKRSIYLSPLGKVIQCTNASKAGFVGSSGMKDEHTGRHYVELGQLSRCNRGIVGIDELSYLPFEDQKALNQGMEDGEISVDKANIHTIMVADFRCIAAGNPKEGRFKKDQIKTEDLGVDLSLLDRFDVIFIIRDIPDVQRDKSVVAKLRAGIQNQNHQKYNDEFIRRYILYARQNFQPILSPEVSEKVEAFYCQIRQMIKTNSSGYCISARQVRAIDGLVRCFAKMRLSNQTDKSDLHWSLQIIETMFQGFGIEISIPQLETVYSDSSLTSLIDRIRAEDSGAGADIDFGTEIQPMLNFAKETGIIFECSPGRYKIV